MVLSKVVKRICLVVGCFLFFYFLFFKTVSADDHLVPIYFFHSNLCSHCKEEEKLLHYIEKRYHQVKVYRYEIHSSENEQILKDVLDLYHVRSQGVPVTVIGDQIYLGYDGDKSPLKFLKTVEYYSRYGYRNRVGEFLKIDSLPFYRVDEKQISLDMFMQEFKNYRIVGNLYTDSLDFSMIAMILGGLTSIHFPFLIGLICLFLSFRKVKRISERFFLVITYFVSSFLMLLCYLFSNQIFTLVIFILFLLFLMVEFVQYFWHKKLKYCIGIVMMILAIVMQIIEHVVFTDSIMIFRNVFQFYPLSFFQGVLYYVYYLMTVGLGWLALFLLIYLVRRKIFLRMER